MTLWLHSNGRLQYYNLGMEWNQWHWSLCNWRLFLKHYAAIHSLWCFFLSLLFLIQVCYPSFLFNNKTKCHSRESIKVSDCVLSKVVEKHYFQISLGYCIHSLIHSVQLGGKKTLRGTATIILHLLHSFNQTIWIWILTPISFSNSKWIHRTRRPRKRPSCKLLRWSRRRRYVPLASNNHGTWRLPLLRRSLLPRHPLPSRLSIQTTQGTLHHPHLPLQH